MASRSFWIGTAAALEATLMALLAFFSAGPAGATFPGENGRIAFGREGDVWIMDPDGSDQTNLTKTPDVPEGGPAFSPDGTKLVFVGAQSGTAGDIYTV